LFGTRGSANLSWSLTGEMDVAIVFLILCCLNLRVVEGRSLGRWSNLTSIFFKWVFQPPTTKWASQLYLICYHSWWSRQVWRAGGRTILLHAWTRGGIDQGLRPLGQKESVVLLPLVTHRNWGLLCLYSRTKLFFFCFCYGSIAMFRCFFDVSPLSLQEKLLQLMRQMRQEEETGSQGVIGEGCSVQPWSEVTRSFFF